MSLHKINLTDFFFEDDHSPHLFLDKDKIEYLTKGKALRAKICEYLGELFAVDKKSQYILSQAIEMIHNATLIHDDVVDYSLKRRGEETLNSFYSNKKTVLVGDYILAKAIYDIADLDPLLIKSVAISLKSLVDGEIFQMEKRNPFKVSLEDYFCLARNKTGALFAWSLSAPTDYAFRNENFTKAMSSLGEELGIIFQIKDDLLDFEISGKTGKTPHIDLRNNNINIVFSNLNSLNSNEYDSLQESDKMISLDNLLLQKIEDSRGLSEELLYKQANKVKNMTKEICDLYLEEKYWDSFSNFVNLLLEKIMRRES